MSFFPRELAAPEESVGPSVEWEETNCLLCGGPNWSTLCEAPDNTDGGTGLWFPVVQCHDCGLCFTNPRPNATSISQFYPSVYSPHRTPSEHARKKGGFRWIVRRSRRARKERQEIPWQGQGRLLDFGCGGGKFLERMHHEGWNVIGLDNSAETMIRLRQELGIRTLVGSLPHPELRPSSLDVITMWHSLEHVHRPLEVLREAHRLLVPGGKLYVAVPNIDSLQFRWFGQAWFGLDLPRHLTHFAPWTLHLMLQRSGFRVGPIEMIRHSDWLRSSARLSCRSPHQPGWRRWLQLKSTSRIATMYSYLTNQTDCMLLKAER